MNKVADLSFPWRGWYMNSEAILVFSRNGASWPKSVRFHSDTYLVSPWGKNGHPNFKPPNVIVDLAQHLSTDKSVILDPFMGSGTTLRAAKDLRRRAIGIEIEERYCETAAKRLEQEVLSFAGDEREAAQTDGDCGAFSFAALQA
jgi:site-specific DNA-methyltransferase (adenine-specific)